MDTKTPAELDAINAEVTRKLKANECYLDNLVSVRASDVYIFHYNNAFLWINYDGETVSLRRVFTESGWEGVLLSQDNAYIPLDTCVQPYDNLPCDPKLVHKRYDETVVLVNRLWLNPLQILTIEMYEDHPFNYIYIPFSGFHRIGSGGDTHRIVDYITEYENKELRFYTYEHMLRDVFAHRGEVGDLKLQPLSDELGKHIYSKRQLLESIRHERFGEDLNADTIYTRQGQASWHALIIDENEHILFIEIDNATGNMTVEKFPPPYTIEILNKKHIDIEQPHEKFITHHVYGTYANKYYSPDPPYLKDFKETPDPAFWKQLVSFEYVQDALNKKNVTLRFGTSPNTYTLNDDKELWHRYGNKPAPLEYYYNLAKANDWFFKVVIEN